MLLASFPGERLYIAGAQTGHLLFTLAEAKLKFTYTVLLGIPKGNVCRED